LERTYAQDPQLYAEFVQASYEGWIGAFEHPDEAIEIVLGYMKNAKLAAGRAHQRWMLNRMKDLIFPQGISAAFLSLNETDYLFVSEKLQENGSIEATPDFDQFWGKWNRHNDQKSTK